jgi:anthranilate/para-aminobenzoate synthase component II
VLRLGFFCNPCAAPVHFYSLISREKFVTLTQDVYDAIVISPGFGCPADAKITLDLIRELGASREMEDDAWMGTPILGVYLGH